MENYLKKEFQNPGTDKRSIPFWAWNAEMDEEEVKWQIRQMKKAGVGGFFIHSRVGLETDYLGEKWMSCVKAAVAEAREQGLYVWLYDEDRWPSGTAGGKVTACGDIYRCKGLSMEILPCSSYAELYQKEIRFGKGFTDDSTGLLAVYCAVVDRDSIVSYRRLEMNKEEIFSQDEVLLAVRLEVSAPSEWFNHEAPPDNLNPDCVRKFIQETHEKYKQAAGDEFGKTIRGIFTDEPSLNDRHCYFGEHKSWIPWTYGYGAFFKECSGYDFFDVLPLFYFHGENSPKVRHDYWCSISQRYGESYFKTLSLWCKENHLSFTGHFLQEDKMGLSTRVNGAIMPNYQYMDIPGIDMLCEQTDEYMTVKQCVSVAHQLGKKYVITETYGCTGWEFTFEGQKWIGDWQYVLGVNRRCQHLMLYSLRGCRKRDYPPCFNYNTTWWGENKIVDDYFARLSVILEQGDAIRNILLIHPVSTAWSRLGVNPYGNPLRREERDVPGINEYGNQLNTLIEHLVRRHLDCDLGDELMIRQYGKIISGQFVIGEAFYNAVVLPPMDTLLRSTCEKLFDYMEQGGVVYAMAPYASFVEASWENVDILERLVSHRNWVIVKTFEELAKCLNPYRSVCIEDRTGNECEDILYQMRKKGNEYYLFLVNNSRDREVDAIIRIPFSAEAVQMDPLSGELQEVSCYENGMGETILRTCLDRTDSIIFYLKEKKTEKLCYEEPFNYRLSHENVLPLDMCKYRVEGSEWSEELEVWQAQKKIRETLKMRPVYHNGIEQRYKWIRKSHPENGTPVELSFHFKSELSLRGAALALERPEDFHIFLNGREISRDIDGWFLDKEIQRWRLPEIWQGDNELILACAYRNDMELENIYLIGKFGVDLERHLVMLPDTLSAGSWTEQGLKHYCGNVTYQIEYTLKEEVCEGSKVWLKLPRIEAVCVKVCVNGSETLLPWNFEKGFSIEKWLHTGKNQIDVEVVGSPRNMMGPFHVKEKPRSTNNTSFCPSEDAYSEEYLLAPYGMMGMPEIIMEMVQ